MSVLPPQILTIKLSRREQEQCVPGGLWCLDKYVGWWRSELRRRGATQLLLVLTAHNCPGCDELKRQFDVFGAEMEKTLILLMECGDLYGACYFGIKWGETELRYPGVPTALLLHLDDPTHLSLLALSLGPLTRGREAEELSGLRQGRSRWIKEAAGVPLRLADPSGTRPLQLDSFTGLKIPLTSSLP